MFVYKPFKVREKGGKWQTVMATSEEHAAQIYLDGLPGKGIWSIEPARKKRR